MGYSNLTNEEETRKLAVDEFTRRARLALGDSIEKIVLFGSMARGDFNSESDIDIMVVVGGIERDQAHNKLSEIAFETNLEFEQFIVLHVITSEWYNSREDFTFYKSVKSEGVLL